MEPTLAELLLAGAKLMAIGMGIVFLFLLLLVWIIGVTSKLLQNYTPKPDVLAARPGAMQAPAGEAEVVAAIAAAIHRFRQS